jgi:ribosomal protein S18 acetylase RimI-like enzyme
MKIPIQIQSDGIDPRVEAQVRQQMAAELHAACIRTGFLPTLGGSFLKVLYRCIDEHAECILLTESINGNVVGFVAGTTGRTSLRRVIGLHPLRAAAALAPSLLSLKRLRGVVRLAKHSTQGHQRAQSWPSAELLSIAVRPDYRGRGVSERLFRRFEYRLGELGVSDFRIMVAPYLAQALSFYRRMGCEDVGRFTLHGNDPSIVLARRITEPTK